MSETSTPDAAKPARFGNKRSKVPAFARFEETSAWKKYRGRARAYARFRAAARLADEARPEALPLDPAGV